MSTAGVLLSVLAAAAIGAEPSPPTTEQVSNWAAFSKPIHLRAEKEAAETVASCYQAVPIWAYNYTARQETLTSFRIGIFKAGTLFGKERDRKERLCTDPRQEIKKMIEEIPEAKRQKIKELLNMTPGTNEIPIGDSMFKDWSRFESRPDGRKVYFTIRGFGPGGTSSMIFTTMGKYDLLLEQTVLTQDGGPKEKQLLNPATATKELSEIFKKLEQHIAAGK